MLASDSILQALEPNGHRRVFLMSARGAMFAIEIGCSEMNKGARNPSRETVLSNHNNLCGREDER
jgi:hypothetical protein